MTIEKVGGAPELLRAQLIAISTAIARTRDEIADLRHGQEAGRSCDELRAVVQSTERATDTILSASEAVDALADGIARGAANDAARRDAQAIREQVQAIFEACNFQDLAGQRISKVVKTIVFVENRVEELLRLWSASEMPRSFPRPRKDGTTAEAALLNGPALPGDASVSQDAVDALFP